MASFGTTDPVIEKEEETTTTNEEEDTGAQIAPIIKLEEVAVTIGEEHEHSSFGFVDYHDRRSAALAIMTLHGRQLYGQEAIKVNLAYASGQREDTTGMQGSCGTIKLGDREDSALFRFAISRLLKLNSIVSFIAWGLGSSRKCAFSEIKDFDLSDIIPMKKLLWQLANGRIVCGKSMKAPSMEFYCFIDSMVPTTSKIFYTSKVLKKRLLLVFTTL